MADYILEDDSADVATLDACVATLDTIEVMTRALAESGPLVPGSMGQPTGNPLLHQLRQERMNFERLVARLKEDPDKVRESVSAAASRAARARWAKNNPSVAREHRKVVK